MTPASESLDESARLGSGITTVYRALDRVVEHYRLDDAVVVVEVPALGRQVLRAGRRPLGDDARELHLAGPGLYADPPLDDALVGELMVALGAIGLRYDARHDHAPPGSAAGAPA